MRPASRIAIRTSSVSTANAPSAPTHTFMSTVRRTCAASREGGTSTTTRQPPVGTIAIDWSVSSP